MPTFVTDSTVLIPGLLKEHAAERRLLVLCAYGQLRWYERFAGQEIAGSTEVRAGGLVGGPIRELQMQAGAKASALAEQLPYDAREDIQLVLSTPILDGLERTLKSERVGAGLAMTAELATFQRLIAASLATLGPSVSISSLPRITGRRDVDLLLETARQARAEFLVSQAPSVVPLYGQNLAHEGLESVTRVCPFESFITYSELDSQLDQVDGSLLRLAVALATPR